MKNTLLILALALSQTGCAMFKAYELGHADRRACQPTDTFQTCALYSQARETQARNAKTWQKWDREYVSDDVLVIEADPKNGVFQAK